MSFVYFIEAGRDIIKVGMAKDVGKRARALQTAGPFEMRIIHKIEIAAEHALALEKAIHKRLKPYRMRGEWFRIERSKAISMAERAASQFAKDRTIAAANEDGITLATIRCRGCGHSGKVAALAKPRVRFKCTQCGSGEVAWLML